MREGPNVEVGYRGRASLERVLEHYTLGLVAAGYAHEVMSATAKGEQHRFGNGTESIELSLLRRADDLLEVQVKLLPE